jgi:small subunit ribosomal protein S27Ae
MPAEKTEKPTEKPSKKPEAAAKIEKTEKVEEVKAPEKVQRKPAGKVEKKKKKEKKISSLYEVDYSKNKATLKNKKCSRCGNIMALHQMPVPRWSCGSCGFTDYVKSDRKD